MKKQIDTLKETQQPVTNKKRFDDSWYSGFSPERIKRLRDDYEHPGAANHARRSANAPGGSEYCKTSPGRDQERVGRPSGETAVRRFALWGDGGGTVTAGYLTIPNRGERAFQCGSTGIRRARVFSNDSIFRLANPVRCASPASVTCVSSRTRPFNRVRQFK